MRRDTFDAHQNFRDAEMINSINSNYGYEALKIYRARKPINSERYDQFGFLIGHGNYSIHHLPRYIIQRARH